MANKTKSLNSFQTRSNLNLNGKNHEYFALTKLNADKKLKQLPIAHKVLL